MATTRSQGCGKMARSRVLALFFVLAACTSAVVPPQSSPPGTRPARTLAPTPFNEGTIRYADTVRGFLSALNDGRYDDALAFIDERILFSGDCDYEHRRLYSITDYESATYWLRARIADHDRLDVVRLVDLADGGSTIGVEIVRTSDTIRAHGYEGGTVRPRVPLFARFSADGRRITQLAFVWSRPVGTFDDCAA